MIVSSCVGGGRHEHLDIIMMNEEYFAIAADIFPLPDNLGSSPEVVASMTAAVIVELTRLLMMFILPRGKSSNNDC
jgi:hypothetical protein